MKLENLMDLCRACLSAVEVTGSYNLFETPELFSKFQTCTTVAPESTFPNVLCQTCYTKLHDFLEFRNMCIDSDKKLQSFIINDIPPEMDDEKPIFDLETAINMAPEASIDGHHSVRRRRGRHRKDDKDPLVVIDKVDPLVKQPDEVIRNEITPRRRPGRPSKQSQFFTVIPPTVTEAETETHQQAVPLRYSREDVSTESIRQKQVRKLKQCIPKEKSKSKIGTRSSTTFKKKMTSRQVVDSAIFKCVLCPKRFFSELCLAAHNRTHDGLVPYPCTFEGCDKSFNRLHHLSRHMKDHEGNNSKFSCNQSGCMKEYKYKSALVYHLRKNHNIGPEFEPQICEVCGKFFKSAAILKEHRFTHRDKLELPHACERTNCSRRFATKDRLRVHMMRHEGIKRYVCPHCGVRKTTSGELKVHINYHTLERTWSCRYCNKVFNRVGNLNTHVRTVHERAKDYPCRFCERSFGKLYTRKCHEMTHTGERPHACDECGKRFTQLSALTTHRKLHQKQRKCTAEAEVTNNSVEHITAQE